MPWQQREIIQFLLLLLCVPLQYYLSGYYNDVKERDRSQILMKTMKGFEDFKNKLLESNFWSLNWQHITVFVPDDSTTEETEEGLADEEPLDGKFPKDFDLPSKLTRVHDARPPELLYRIGQVVQLSDHAFRGVIVGWEVENEDTDQPVYTILVDESHLKKGMFSIVVEAEQDKLFVIRSTEVTHRSLKWYFISFDGSQYLPRVWLKKLFPKD